MVILIHSVVMHLADELQRRLSDANLTPYKAALKAGIDPPNLRMALQGKRPFSDLMLEALSTVPEIGLTYDEMIAMSIVDRYGIDRVRKVAEWLQRMRLKD